MSRRDDTLKEITASFRQLEEKLISLRNEKRVPEETSEDLMRKYSEQNTVVGVSVGRLVKSVLNLFLGIVMCISRTITEWRNRGKEKLVLFSTNLPQYWIGRSEQSSKCAVNTGDREREVALNLFLLVGVSIYKRSSTSQITVRVALAQLHA